MIKELIYGDSFSRRWWRATKPLRYMLPKGFLLLPEQAQWELNIWNFVWVEHPEVQKWYKEVEFELNSRLLIEEAESIIDPDAEDF